VLKSLDRDVAAFEGIRYEPQELVAVGDHVMVPMRQTGRGKTSGVLIEEDIVTVWKLAGGKAIESRVYSTEREALDALGLTQRPGGPTT
jgi:hypothetical protein